MKAVVGAIGGVSVLCLLVFGCTDTRRPDLTTLLSPPGSETCAEQVSVGTGIVHAFAVIHVAGRSSAACAIARQTLQPISNSPTKEPAAQIRGTMKCQLIGYPDGKNSDQIVKVYVFSDGSANTAARTVCDQLRANADPSYEFQNL